MNSVPPEDPVAVVSTNFASVAVSERVNEIFLPSDVVIVFPPLYADCRVVADGGHLTTLSLASTPVSYTHLTLPTNREV